MDKKFDFGALLQNHDKKHKALPSQFVSVAGGVKKRLESNIKYRKSSRLTVFDKIRNLQRCDSPIPKKDIQAKVQHRMLQLEKWKEEKEKKKKEAASQKKKPFVAGVPHNPLKFVPPPPPKPIPSLSGMVTRSQTVRNNNIKLNTTKPENKKAQSFAPKNAKFNPVLNNILKPALTVPMNDAKKKMTELFKPFLANNEKVIKTSKPKTTQKSLSKLKNDKKMGPIQNKKSKTNNFTSESSCSLESNPSKSPVKSRHSKSTSTDAFHTKSLVTLSNSKSGANTLTSESSDSIDSSSAKTSNRKVKTPRKSIANEKMFTPKNTVPKSESSSEERLRSLTSVGFTMTPEQIEVEAKRISPCVTLSRGKDNARREMKKKINEGLLDDDVCEIDSVDHFRRQLDSEIKRMTGMCETWEKIFEQITLPESIQESLLTAVGQARLLMSQKLQQFAGLLARCGRAGDEPAVKPGDLAGFWDMVFMQVENIDVRFKRLEELRARNWVEELSPARPAPAARPMPAARPAPATRPAPADCPPRPKNAAASRLKDVIAAARKAKKEQEAQAAGAPAGGTPARAPARGAGALESKTFEAGFFSVRSPVRSPARSPAHSPVRSPARSPATRSLLQAVLSSEAKKSASKSCASFAMLRASFISKNVDNKELQLFLEDKTPLTPVNLCATPARSILKSATKSTKKGKKKSIKVVLFDNSDLQDNSIIVDEPTKTSEISVLNEDADADIENGLSSRDVEKDSEHKENKEDKRRSKLIRQNAVEDRSPVMTRSRRKSLQTPLPDEKTPRRSIRKNVFQVIEVNTLEEKISYTPKNLRRKSLNVL